jgi:hypothetical protein
MNRPQTPSAEWLTRKPRSYDDGEPRTDYTDREVKRAKNTTRRSERAIKREVQGA